MIREEWLVAKFKRESEVDLTPEQNDMLIEYLQYQRHLAFREVVDELESAKLFSAAGIVKLIA